jgi:hypothetical protein
MTTNPPKLFPPDPIRKKALEDALDAIQKIRAVKQGGEVYEHVILELLGRSGFSLEKWLEVRAPKKVIVVTEENGE